MSDTKHEQSTLHGKALSDAVKADHTDAVPGNDKAHAHSHAAHLGEEGAATTPENIGKQGREAGSMTEPPQDPKMTGKVHERR